MSRRVSFEVDGANLTMITDESQEHIEQVLAMVHDAISLMKRKNDSISSASIYRYVMVYLADQIVDLQEILANEPRQTDEGSLEDENLNLKKELQALRQLQMNWEGRVSQLQELLLEKNQLIQELRDKK
ncbi:MAG: hypothetical protein GX978_06585 [Tissierellia bacterium]|jgi:cell division protein ZapA (FtsZ GTPase activity inhibitor)|nr:hypothetical protein [Tissierellia bacterium]